jgi:hypothetical protein
MGADFDASLRAAAATQPQADQQPASQGRPRREGIPVQTHAPFFGQYNL